MCFRAGRKRCLRVALREDCLTHLAALVRKGFRYRIYPTPAQAARLIEWDHALRFLWNLALEQHHQHHRAAKKHYPTAFSQAKELTELRAELLWLADVPRNVSAQLLVEMERAWERCFMKLSKQPRWKKKDRDEVSLCEPHPKAWRLDGDVIRFPKLGNLRAVIHRPLEGKPKTCTIRRDGDQWFASIVCEIEVDEPTPRHEPVVAIDRGVVNLLADSDGKLIENPRFSKQAAARMRRAQRSVAP